MTTIELNIAGLRLTRSTPSREAVVRLWQRNCKTWRQNSMVLRHRQASGRPAA